MIFAKNYFMNKVINTHNGAEYFLNDLKKLSIFNSKFPLDLVHQQVKNV